MNVSVIGLGYVGSVFSACLADMGHNVIGFDCIQKKVDSTNNGLCSIKEVGLKKLLNKQIQRNLLRATISLEDAVINSNIAFICVGTPNKIDGSLDLTEIFNLAERITILRRNIKEDFYFIIRSTVEPGTCSRIQIFINKILQKNNSKTKIVCIYNPEFLREGCAIEDFYNPPYVIFGMEDKNEKIIQILKKIYIKMESKTIYMSMKESEFIKCISNSWHALKVCFANEVGAICKGLGTNPNEVLDVFCKDNKLNISSSYLMPGSPYGGSCLPKDLAALNSMSKKQDLSSPLLGSIAESNKNFYEKLVNNVKLFVKENQFLIHGISFKNGTDDIRNSPGFNLAIDLLKDNYKFNWFDQDILDTLNEYGFESAFFTQFPLDLLDLMVIDPFKLLDNKEHKIVITKSLCKNSDLEKVYKENEIFYFSI